MATRYITALGAGSANGSSWANAAAFKLDALNTQIGLAGAGGSVLFSAADVYSMGPTASPTVTKTITAGGTAGNRVVIRGADPADDTPKHARINSYRTWPYKQGAQVGADGWTISADHLEVSWFQWTNCQFCLIPNVADDIVISNHKCRNIRKFIAASNDLTNFLISRIRAVQFSKDLIRFDNRCVGGIVEDVYGDCGGQNFDGFPAGITTKGDAEDQRNSDILVRRCVFRRLLDYGNNINQYRNGDGVSNETYDDPITIEDVLVAGCTDSCIDLKGGGHLTRVVSRHTKSGFRYWYQPIEFHQCSVIEPMLWDYAGLRAFSHSSNHDVAFDPVADFYDCYFLWDDTTQTNGTPFAIPPGVFPRDIVNINQLGADPNAYNGAINFHRTRFDIGTGINMWPSIVHYAHVDWTMDAHSSVVRI